MLSFDEAVERIRELSQQEGLTAFEMGDVVLELCPLGEVGVSNDRDAILGQLAEPTGVSAETLRERRLVAARTPKEVRTTFSSWSVALLIAKQGDPGERQRLLRLVTQTKPTNPRYKTWTVNAVRDLQGKAPTWAADAVVAAEMASPETKAEVFQTLAADDHIVNEASDYTTPTAQALGRLEVASSHRAAQRTTDHYAHDPVIQAIDGQRALLDLAELLRTFAEQVDVLLPACAPLAEAGRDPFGHELFLTAALLRGPSPSVADPPVHAVAC